MDGRNGPRFHHGLLAALTLWGCGAREAASPSEFTTTAEEFENSLSAEFHLENKFDRSTSELRTEDRLDDISKKLDCRLRRSHLQHVGSLLEDVGFDRAFDGQTGPCFTWGRSQSRTTFLSTRDWAKARLPAAFHVIRDVVRVCVELRPEDSKCVTTYRPYAVRLLQAKPEGDYVRLQSPELANDLGKNLVGATHEGIEYWSAKDQ